MASLAFVGSKQELLCKYEKRKKTLNFSKKKEDFKLLLTDQLRGRGQLGQQTTANQAPYSSSCTGFTFSAVTRKQLSTIKSN